MVGSDAGSCTKRERGFGGNRFGGIDGFAAKTHKIPDF